MTDNKRVTNKQILEELERFRKALSKAAVDFKLPNEDLNVLATKIVNKMTQLKSMEDWYKHIFNSAEAFSADYEHLEMSEEEDALGEAARLMTLMNLFQDKEEYEKCAIIKRQMKKINKILSKYK
jgi:PBP1b-binding outer membrane lipoprotein LpoB